MKITFIHTNKAFLPEMDAYRHFFSTCGVETSTGNYDHIAVKPDVEWHFMGMHRRRKWKDTLVIHEYASASVPPFRVIKDQLKRWTNSTPGFRLFLNRYVQQQLGFNDNVPFGFRDMGLAAGTIGLPPGDIEKHYDFIYTGSVSADMQMGRLLQLFAGGPLQQHTLLLLAREYESLAVQYSRWPNIIFKGPVPQAEVRNWLQQAQFCINYKPVIEPHSHQTSTKLLEYLAAGIPVITTDSPWVRQFQQNYGGSFFYLEEDLSNFTWEHIRGFPYSFPDLSEWSWDNQIRRSGVLEFLQSKYPGISF